MFWSALPDDPLGIYRVVATQGSVSAAGDFNVVTATAPRMFIQPYEGPPGTAFSIGLAGLLLFGQLSGTAADKAPKSSAETNRIPAQIHFRPLSRLVHDHATSQT